MPVYEPQGSSAACQLSHDISACSMTLNSGLVLVNPGMSDSSNLTMGHVHCKLMSENIMPMAVCSHISSRNVRRCQVLG